MPSVGGQFSIEQFARKLQEAATPEFRGRLARRIGEQVIRELQRQFRAGMDPYGVAWPLPIGRPGGLAMRDSGRLGNSFTAAGVQVLPQGFAILTNVIYAEWLQSGTRFMAPRIMLPESSDRLASTRYAEIMNREAGNFMREHFGLGGN